MAFGLPTDPNQYPVPALPDEYGAMPPGVAESIGLGAPPVQPMPGDLGAMPPGVAESIGLAPPQQQDIGPPPAAWAPPLPQELPQNNVLPSTAGRPARTPAPPRPDIVLPPPDVLTPRPPVKPSQPAKAPTYDQSAAQYQRGIADVNAERQQANVAQTNAQLGEDADKVAAAAKYQADADALQAKTREIAADREKKETENAARIGADRAALDNYKINPTEYLDKLGVGDQLGWVISMALSGIGNAIAGNATGPNPVIQMFQAKIKDAVTQQIDQRDQLSAKLGRDKETALEDRQFSKDRSAEINYQMGMAETAFAKSIQIAGLKSADPMHRANAQLNAAAINADGVEKLHAAAKQDADHSIAVKKVQIDAFQAGETARHNRAVEDLTAQQRDIEAAKAARAGQADQAKLIRERALGGGEAIPIKDTTGKIIGYQPQGLLKQQSGDRKGEVWIPNGTETQISKLQDAHVAATQLAGTLDEIRKLGPEFMTGKWGVNSPKYQQMKELFGDARLQALKAKELGVPTGHDIELAEGFLGGDPTAVRTAVAGIEEARKSLIRDHNARLRIAGFDGEWSPLDVTTLPEPKETPVEARQKVLLSKAHEVTKDPFAPIPEPGTVRLAPKGQELALIERFPMHYRQRDELNTLAAGLQSNDPNVSRQSFSLLSNARDNSPEEGVREYSAYLIQQAAQRVAEGNMTPTEETSTASGPGMLRGGRSHAPVPADAAALQALTGGARP